MPHTRVEWYSLFSFVNEEILNVQMCPFLENPDVVLFQQILEKDSSGLVILMFL
jgi:hypothetical protein